jgi:hypothetical protein
MEAFRRDIAGAARSCRASHLTYFEPQTVKRVAQSADAAIEVMSHYDGRRNKAKRRDAQAYMMRRGNRLTVAFRGTLTNGDVIDAVDIRHATRLGGRLHRGFYEQFMSVQEDITADLDAALRADQTVESLDFTGHSMGGGLAVIAAVFYGGTLRNVTAGDLRIECHAFGCPQFADEKLVRAFSASVDHSMCVNVAGDLVTMLPIHDDFVQLPNTLEILDGAAVSCVRGRGARPSYAALLRQASRVGTVENALDLHSIATYCRRLNALRDSLFFSEH